MPESHLTAPAEDQQPPRVLGPIDATCIVIGAIIGVGIFSNTATVARICQTESLTLLVWGIGGAIALCGALVFAELGGMYHSSGAQYEILRDSYGPFLAFLFVFGNATIIEPGSIAFIAAVCAQYLLVAVGAAPLGSQPEGAAMMQLAVTLIGLLTAANMIGVRWGARIQNFTVYSKVATLIVITALAVLYAPHTAPNTAATTVAATAPASMGLAAAILTALIPTLFTYGGWQQALWIAGEIRNPARNMPRAIIGGVIIVIIVYLAANWAYLKFLGAEGVAQTSTVAADTVGLVWGDAGRRFAAAAVAVSAFGVLNVQLLTGPRLIFGMARDGRFFRIFSTLSPRFGTPVTSILLLAAVGIALLFIFGKNGSDQLVTDVVQIDALFFILTAIALIVLRYKKPRADRPIRVPGYPIIPILFALGELGAVVGAYVDPNLRKAALYGAAWMVVGAVLFLIGFRRPADGLQPV